MASFDFEKLTAEALENVSGGADEFETNSARWIISVAKSEGLTLDEAIAKLNSQGFQDICAKNGNDYDEIIRVMREEW